MILTDNAGREHHIPDWNAGAELKRTSRVEAKLEARGEECPVVGYESDERIRNKPRRQRRVCPTVV
jgi:TusA-related sulfurtransferase